VVSRARAPVVLVTPGLGEGDSVPGKFDAAFTAVFDAAFGRLFRVLDRLSGDPELASDLAQEAFIRLYRRGSLPDQPHAWLVTVALNLFRNARKSRRRRGALLTLSRGAAAHSDPPATPEQLLDADETRRRVRYTLDSLDERGRCLLLLSAEGYEYREIAAMLGLNPASVGTLLARARGAFRAAYQGASHDT
jgi:RNA polymerase sigma-70 factor (ECF subfamily)